MVWAMKWKEDVLDSDFIGTLLEVRTEQSSLEGIEQTEFSLIIRKSNGEDIREFIPIATGESEEEFIRGSPLYHYLNHIRNHFPNTKDLVNAKDALKTLQDKPLLWTGKALERELFKIPPKKYLVPMPTKTVKEEAVASQEEVATSQTTTSAPHQESGVSAAA